MTLSIPPSKMPNNQAAATAARPAIFLHPGQTAASAEPTQVNTIVGSCVAVCVWDSVAGIGGMTHFLLPNWDGDRVSSPRYGDVAVPELLKKVAELGAQKSQLRAKIFGGAAIFQALDHEKEHLGHKNARFATDLLLQLQIPLVGKETGGRRGRRITFWTHTGECSVAEL